MPLILLGSKGRNSVRGKKPSMATKAIEALKRAEKEGLLIICEVNEDYTSQVCHLCQERSLIQKRVQDGRTSLWRVKECTICGHNFDRDYNAAQNILHLGLLEFNGVDHPLVLSHADQQQ